MSAAEVDASLSEVVGWTWSFERMVAAFPREDRAVLSLDASLDTLQAMRLEQRKLVADGRWRGGPRSLLGALRLQQQELVLTAGLAWLLRPDGHHALGPQVLRALLDALAITPDSDLTDVRVVLEETRGQDEARRTRADLLVYGRDFTLVLEAKTGAPEQPEQLDRLHRLWADDPEPTFVFLTRGSRSPVTAVLSSGAWQPLAWLQVGRMVRQVVTASGQPSPGAMDYATTLEAYHDV